MKDQGNWREIFLVKLLKNQDPGVMTGREAREKKKSQRLISAPFDQDKQCFRQVSVDFGDSCNCEKVCELITNLILSFFSFLLIPSSMDGKPSAKLHGLSQPARAMGDRGHGTDFSQNQRPGDRGRPN